ncbi:diguanylate cyclase [Microvirga tunisiensis]|uniref:diguanylate cyclase n=2 Tax=Pannonibacter tanglangensis TaxID=2750084 RepID=A0A7X5F5B2_9HYPH|nr:MULTISPECIES: diguanylate cyclase [unclassified Pannonibacter]NBN65737.1 diguanylate cyclase [Pannonibacter sp. XCT-34]NBN80036.1 diguanylate cyclase [Pannonibacter sp. XCT-53]
MQTILLVEDATFFEKAALKKLADIGDYDVVIARDFAEAKRILETARHMPDLALVDLTLPDAPDGEIVDLCMAHKLATVVFTSRFEPRIRNAIRQKGVLDYVVKDSPSSLDYLGELVQRLGRNASIGVLVIDDASVERSVISDTISRHRYKVYQARSSNDGMEMLANNPDIRLVLVDYFMPDEDGFAFLKAVRRKHGREQLAVLGMSSSEDTENRIRFLKYGANDFIHKSCPPEELLLRISQNLDVIDRFATLSDRSLRDTLTGLYNRRYLYGDGVRRCQEADAANQPTWLALIDVDEFKTINDSRGHGAGDEALLLLASELNRLTVENGFAIRIGGDEFCAVVGSPTEAEAHALIEGFRKQLENRDVIRDGHCFRITVSIGLARVHKGDISEALRVADTYLYAAKSAGRNRLVAS